MQQIVVGLDDVTDQLLVALFAGGHVLLEGVPGTAKTTICRTFATILGIQFERGELSQSELGRAEELVKEKYINDDWTKRI